jgi:hypothetical protein
LDDEQLQAAAEELRFALSGVNGSEEDIAEAADRAGAPGPPARAADMVRKWPFPSRAALTGLAFVVGLLMGWLIIGWWLWPVEWANSGPWRLRSDYQQAYIRLLADDYGRTGDIERVRQALRGWDGKDLSRRLATMQAQADSLEERRRLAELAEALALPDPEASVWTVSFDQKVLLFTFLLSAPPFVTAVVLALLSAKRKHGAQGAGKRVLGAGLDELEDELTALWGEKV